MDREFHAHSVPGQPKGGWPELGGHLTLFWAKRQDAEIPYHPVLCHLLDVANVARLIWQEVFHQGIRQRLSADIGLPENVAGPWLAFFAGCHHLAKFCRIPFSAMKTCSGLWCTAGSFVTSSPEQLHERKSP